MVSFQRFQLPKFSLEIFVNIYYLIYNNLMHMDPIGNKPIGFYGLSMVYTMSLFLDVIHILKLSLFKIIFYIFK